MYKRMLVPLDGSKLAEVVFPYARELSGLLGTEIILLHISNLGKDFQPMSHAYVEHAAEHIKGRETSEWKALLTKPISVNSDLVSGYPPDEILRYAEEKKVDLILMASHGRSGLSHLTIGSVAERVLLETNIPVFMITHGAADK